MATQEGFVERWAGILLRYLMLYVALVGVLGVVFSIYALNAGGFVWAVGMMVPYATIRLRDQSRNVQSQTG